MNISRSLGIAGLTAAIALTFCQRKPQVQTADLPAPPASATPHADTKKTEANNTGRPAETAKQPVKQAARAESQDNADEPVKTIEGYATWYKVPPNSLPARRAEPGELVAAHDSLPKGTRVRVTNKENGRSTIVRITDDGVHKKGTIDLSKTAAEQIGLVGEGRASVRMDVLKPESSIASEVAKDMPVAAPALPKEAVLPSVSKP